MPETLRLSASHPEDVARAAELLRAGGTVAFPTETVYGLGANALSPEAVAAIFAAKERPSWDPLIVHVAEYLDVLALVEMDAELGRRVERLAAAFWPGPLTLLLPRRPHVPDAVTAGRPLVGIRIPAHPAAQALLRAACMPLAAPSANRFGHTSPTTAQHVLDDLAGRIDAVLDAGPTRIGIESTVLDPSPDVMTLYRPGSFTPEQIEVVAEARVRLFKPEDSLAAEASTQAARQAGLPAPGIGLRHYAPHAELILVQGGVEALERALADQDAGRLRVGVLLPNGWLLSGTQYLTEPWASWNDADRLAARLFSGLRRLDARGAQVIYCPLPPAGGLRDAIRDRLQKAARLA